MKLKIKSWVWYLTFPFAHNNYTTIKDTIYYPKGFPPSDSVIRHEVIHSCQQAKVGAFKFIFLYLFALPFFYNPWRYKWEYEAFTKGSGYSDEETKKILGSYMYGWLKKKNCNHEWFLGEFLGEVFCKNCAQKADYKIAIKFINHELHRFYDPILKNQIK